jgi:tyrosyl-tRNA synthetase
MGSYFRLATRWNPTEIESLETAMKSSELHPRDAKMKLAREITEIFYSSEESQRAEEAFVRVFQQKDLPDEMFEYVLQTGQSVLDVLVASKMVDSKSEAGVCSNKTAYDWMVRQ